MKIRLLIRYFGSALESLNVSADILAELPGFGPKLVAAVSGWKNNNAWKQDLELAEKYGVKLIPYTSPHYPKRLLDIVDYPALLYVKGTLDKADGRSIAIVGTRHASIYGMEMAEKFAKDLAASQITVISGLARGIDTAAHQGALQAGRTLAVIGSGLACLYPQENNQLAEAIFTKGAVISEFPMATLPDRCNFPQRNRIVSGMAKGTLLIEAPLRSGAMITMSKALTQKRELFVLPGPIDNENFQGNHQLIKERKAQLVDHPKDIIGSFENLFCHREHSSLIHQDLETLEPEEKKFLSMLPREELVIDDIIKITKLPMMKINVLLMSLVLKQCVKEFPGKIYRKTYR